MDGRRGSSKAAVAAEAWAALLDLTMGQRNRFFRILQEFGLTPGDLRALFALDGDHPRPMRTLAQVWACDASNVTWMVDRLERRGLVERRMLPSDRRVKTVALTPLGARAKAELFTRLHEPPDDFLALDRATLQALRDALAQLPASLRAPGLHDWPLHAPERPRRTPPATQPAPGAPGVALDRTPSGNDHRTPAAFASALPQDRTTATDPDPATAPDARSQVRALVARERAGGPPVTAAEVMVVTGRSRRRAYELLRDARTEGEGTA
jgi:DNA-binding MarR family transcriptional regulator